jgi:hypothetical protein
VSQITISRLNLFEKAPVVQVAMPEQPLDSFERPASEDLQPAKQTRAQGDFIMKKFAITTAAFGALAAGAVAIAGAASAVPIGGSNADEAVRNLQSQGFNVQINGAGTAPLSHCIVSDVHGLNNSNVDSSGRRIDTTQFNTVTVDVFCPSHS